MHAQCFQHAFVNRVFHATDYVYICIASIYNEKTLTDNFSIANVCFLQQIPKGDEELRHGGEVYSSCQVL